MRTHCPWICLVLLLAAGSGQLGAQDLAVVGGTLIDGRGGTPRANTTVLIEDGKFSAILPADAGVPEGLQQIDARGKYLIPGLIDNHAHFRDWQPEFFIAHGITTVHDLGNRPEWIQALKEAVAKGKMKGPRMFRAGMIIQAPPDPERMEVPSQRQGRLVYVRTAEEARAEVKRQVEAGTDAVKVYAPLSPEQLAAITDEAHKANIPVAGHVLNARDAVLAGIDFIEHTEGIAIATVDQVEKYERVMRERYQGDVNFFGGVPTGPALARGYPPHHLMNPSRFQELIDLMVRHNTFFNPTLLNHWKGFNGRRQEFDEEVRALLAQPKLDYVPLATRVGMFDYAEVDGLEPELREMVFAGYQKVKEFLKAFVQAGGKVVAGVDATAIPGLGTHQEMVLLVDAGLTPMQALLSATLWSAQMMRKDHLFGSVEVGKLGDLVVLKRNPVEDIRNSRSIEEVIKEGVIQDTEYQADFAIPIPRPDPTSFPPWITSLSPRLAVEGAEGVKISVGGGGFSRSSIILFDEIPVSTRYLSRGELEGSIPSRLLTRVGTFPVSVQNSGAGGGVSGDLKFMVKFR